MSKLDGCDSGNWNDHREFMRALTKFAVAFIVVGVAVSGAPTFGFSSVASDRGTTVSVAENNNALIALMDESPAEFPNNEFVTAASVENNIDGDVTVDYTISVSDTAVGLRFDGDESYGELTGTTTISTFKEIELDCASSGQRESNMVTMTVAITEAAGPGVGVRDAEMELVFDCEDGGTTEPSDSAVFERLEAEAGQGNIKEVGVTFETTQTVDVAIRVSDGSGELGSETVTGVEPRQEYARTISWNGNTNPVQVDVTASDPDDGSEIERCVGEVSQNDEFISLSDGGFDCG